MEERKVERLLLHSECFVLTCTNCIKRLICDLGHHLKGRKKDMDFILVWLICVWRILQDLIVKTMWEKA